MATTLRDLPAVHRFLAERSIAAYSALLGPAAVKGAIGSVLDGVRARGNAAAPEIPSFEMLLASVCERLAREEVQGLVEVLNATGILLHTNLGRAPLAPQALDALAAVAGGYSNLEFDLDSGRRGSRYARLSTLLRETTGAEDGLVVNNCAAAVLLVLDTFARGREVIVSRNQLIEIGGGFRLPDVLARSGARLVEVGATNRVYPHDFERALTPQTALLLRSHTSNYRIEGFVEDVSAAQLATLGRRAGVPTVEDLGSGVLIDLAAYGLPREPTVGSVVADGIDMVAFSGDKLLGGPQAGIIVGRSAAIARMRSNPLLRALRVDKATLAALAATLRLYLEPGGLAKIPLYAMLGATLEELGARATRTAAALDCEALSARVVATEGFTGGGTLPLTTLPSRGVSLVLRDADAGGFAARLRAARPPIVGRVEGAAVVLDLRTIPPQRDDELVRGVLAGAG